MRTITRTINLYTFQELLDAESKGEMKKACQKTRDWLISAAIDNTYWYEPTIDHWTSVLKEFGFLEASIRWSGFNSQGDGASFDCESIDINRLITILLSDPMEMFDSLSSGAVIPFIAAKANYRPNPLYKRLLRVGLHAEIYAPYSYTSYCHERTRAISISGVNQFKHKRLGALVAELQKDAEAFRLNLCKAIYRNIEADYNYLTDDKQLVEMADANDYTFNDNGERENE